MEGQMGVGLLPTGADSGAVAEEKDLVRFEQADEFLAILHGPDFFPEMLGQGHVKREEDEERIRSSKSEAAMKRLMDILDLYQEQSYLLDPYLDVLVKPPVQALQEVVRAQHAVSRPSASAPTAQLDTSGSSTQRLAQLLYYFTKVRGYKTIVHFFPHAVGDLQPTLTLLEVSLAAPTSNSTPSTWSTWEVRYILLLWLSLICMIPFDLVKFDSSHDSTTSSSLPTSSSAATSTQKRIETVAKAFLASPGKERDAAALLLGKLFQRNDASKDGLNRFLGWAREVLLPPSTPSVFLATGILQTVCSVLKTSSAETLAPHMADISRLLSLFSADEDEARDAVDGRDPLAPELSRNSLVAKYRAKMACRMGIKALRPRRRQVRGLKARRLGDPAKNGDADKEGNADEDEEDDVPEELDGYIGKLLDSLQDKDTVVRYSAAKGLARLCTRLPPLFIDQAAQAVTDLFSINVVDFMGKRQDLSNVSEHTWQGACLALAELARRGLLRGDDLGDKLEWVQKALVFDVRRGAHSVGTGVRDAACYVLWALARAHDAAAIRPYAESLSHQLVCVTLLDRDVSIRRAASAAYQECVGRLGLFAHGIDVIRKTDFFAVSVRRNAFLECAPQVAVHAEYKGPILEHALSTTVFHWDVAMRELGAASVAKITQIDLGALAPSIVKRMRKSCSSRDMLVLHGSLLTLAEVSAVCSSCGDADKLERCRADSFGALDLVPLTSLRTLGSLHVLRGACRLIETACSAQVLASGVGESTSPKTSGTRWETILQVALARQEEEIHLSAAQAWGAVSQCRNSKDCATSILDQWKSFNVAQQQSHTRVLGHLDFAKMDSDGAEMLVKTLSFLLGLIKKGSTSYSTNVETRRNAVLSIVSSLYRCVQAKGELAHEALGRSQEVFEALLGGLDDYTTDARGDVGSWVRMACLSGLGELVEMFDRFEIASMALPQHLYDEVIAGVMKQMVERIDGIRAEAGKQLLAIIYRRRSDGNPTVQRPDLFARVFPLDDRPDPTSSFKDPKWIFPKAIDLLTIPAYRSKLLEGLVLSIGSKLEMSQQALGKSLCDLVLRNGRPSLSPLDGIEDKSRYPPLSLVQDLAQLASKHVSSNRLFVPILQTALVLLQGGAFSDDKTATQEVELQFKKLLTLANRSIEKIKSPQRVLASMQLTLELIGFAGSPGRSIVSDSIGHAKSFLLHAFPTVRGATADALYIVVQDHFYDALQEVEGGEEADDLLLLTLWVQKSPLELKQTADRLLQLIIKAAEKMME